MASKIQDLVANILKEQKIKESPVDVDAVAKALGATVIYSPSLNNDLSGMIFIEGDKTIIGVNSVHHRNRQRFTIAHEIGHFLLHKNVNESNSIHVDGGFVQTWNRDGRSSQGQDADEIEANRFAAELLMPTKFLEKDIAELGSIDMENDEHLIPLAAKYEVSLHALSLRLAKFLSSPD